MACTFDSRHSIDTCAMATQSQLSFLSRGPLFEVQVHRQYVTEMRGRGVPQEAARVAALREWIEALAAAGRVSSKAKETSLEQLFNQKVLGEVLGYSLYPGAQGSAWPKASTSVIGIGKEPDVMLGRFVPGEEPEFLAVLELKRPGTDLDAPQVGRKPPLSSVQQAFGYGERILGVRWVLVSDMQIVRLYSVESPHESLSFDLRRCIAGEAATPAFRELYWFLSRECLVDGGAESPVSLLLGKSVSRQLEVRDSFYEVYYQIRADLLHAVEAAVQGWPQPPTRSELLQSTQRLLDRMLFLYYCEDNPDQLIPRDTVKFTTEAARRLPGSGAGKVYEALKELFREVDAGSPPTSAMRLQGYNGELFKHDPIVDAIELPDTLHDKRYPFSIGGTTRGVQGVWGLHAFDFWRELNEHLLGHIFEQSLSDMQALSHGQAPAPDRLRQRKQNGIYYTSEVLSDHLTSQALDALLRDAEHAAGSITRKADVGSALEARQQHLGQLRIVDMACGSGAFLVSSYQALLEEYWSIRDGLGAMQSSQPDLLSLGQSLSQAELLRDALYGADLLPQAVEIAKLALWLRSARKGEKVPDLSANLVAADSLSVAGVLGAMRSQLGSFDLVVGNPPWGGEIAPDVYDACCAHLGLDPEPAWDSWELFVAFGLALLRDGGRLAFVLPDTIFSPEKERIRRIILTSGSIEYFHNVGTDWFEKVRMGTTLLQVRRGPVPLAHTFKALLLSGTRRRRAIDGSLPLTQLVSAFARDIPQERCAASATAEIEVFRSVQDDVLIDTMTSHSHGLAELCDRGRGEEINKAGVLWICPSCLTATVPGAKRKRDPQHPDGPRYRPKTCTGCDLELTEDTVGTEQLVVPLGAGSSAGHTVAFIDGEDIARRYLAVTPSKELRLDFKGFAFKPAVDYAATKLLIRQAGVGLLATLDTSGARVPQSVYWYRLEPAWEAMGYTHEFLLGVLLSRTMAYYVFKRFGEVDPARAHAKVTHERLRTFPIPQVDFADRAQRRLHDEVAEAVRELLRGEADVGGPEDMRIDVALRRLWHLSPEDGLHVALELAQLPTGQVIRDLYPAGIPKQILEPDGASALAVASEIPAHSP
jgi:hypothetical protein